MPAEQEQGPLAGLRTFIINNELVPVGTATAFVSHAWKYQFEDLAAALEAEPSLSDPAQTSTRPPYLWLDTATVNQVKQVLTLAACLSCSLGSTWRRLRRGARAIRRPS